jgi:hypothetical protein
MVFCLSTFNYESSENKAAHRHGAFGRRRNYSAVECLAHISYFSVGCCSTTVLLKSYSKVSTAATSSQSVWPACAEARTFLQNANYCATSSWANVQSKVRIHDMVPRRWTSFRPTVNPCVSVSLFYRKIDSGHPGPGCHMSSMCSLPHLPPPRQISLCSSGYPITLYVDQAGSELTEICLPLPSKFYLVKSEPFKTLVLPRSPG